MMRDPARRKRGFPSMALVAIVFAAAQAGGLARSAEEPAAQREHEAEPAAVLIDWTFSPLSKLAADGVDEGNIHSDWTFSPSGNLAASVGVDDGDIHFWDLEHGTTAVLGTVTSLAGPSCLAFSPDEGRLLIGDSSREEIGYPGGIRVLSIAAGREIRRIPLPVIEDRGSNPQICGYYDQVRLAFVGEGRHVLAHLLGTWGTAFVGGSYSAVFLFDAETGEQLHAFEGALGDVSEDGRFALTYDSSIYTYGIRENVFYLVDLETYETLRRFGHTSVDGARFEDDERVIVSQSDDGVVIRWDRETGEQLRPNEKP